MTNEQRAHRINASKHRLLRMDVEAIPSPDYTKTWHPISHAEVLQSLDMVVQSQGVTVRNETYSIKNGGRNMFGTWTLDIPLGNSFVQIGFRNSLMKTFAVGICAGTHVIACSNMQFSGDYLEFRKHTSGLDFDELLITANAAFSGVIAQSTELHQWQEGLRSTPVIDDDAKILTYDAMDSGILAPNRFKAFQESYGEEIELSKGESSVYEFHGAITRMNRDNNLFTVANRTNVLNGMCDEFITRKAA